MVILRDGMCPGLNKELIQALRAADISTVEDLVSSDVEDLAQQCSVSYKALLAVRRVLLAQHAAFPVSGADLYEELQNSTAILSTGNPSLDKLLDSGLYTGELTELAGSPGSGKTQVCLGVAVHTALNLRKSVVYVDSTGGLSASRLLEMLQTVSCNKEEQMEALQKIQIFQVFDIFSLLGCLHDLRCDRLQQGPFGGGSVKTVIVDSVAAVISPILGGKQSDGMSLMMQVGILLKTIAKDFNVAVLVTNHVTRDNRGELKAGLGLSWSHVPRTRVLLERLETPASSSSSIHTAALAKSSRQPCQLKIAFDLKQWGKSEDQDKPPGKRKFVD